VVSVTNPYGSNLDFLDRLENYNNYKIGSDNLQNNETIIYFKHCANYTQDSSTYAPETITKRLTQLRLQENVYQENMYNLQN
jgi:hypothetical protein